jgi:hypothetical protein
MASATALDRTVSIVLEWSGLCGCGFANWGHGPTLDILGRLHQAQFQLFRAPHIDR